MWYVINVYEVTVCCIIPFHFIESALNYIHFIIKCVCVCVMEHSYSVYDDGLYDVLV